MEEKILSGNNQEFAEPEIDNLSENNQEVAEPVNNNGGNEVTGENKVQSRDENARFAAARRKAENEANIAINRMNDYARSQGFKDFDELERHSKENKTNALYKNFEEETGISASSIKPIIDSMLENNPDVLEARKIAENNRMTEAQKAFDAEIGEIGKLDSSIKNFNDILEMPNFEEFDKLVHKGYSLVDAFKIVNFDKINGQNADKVKQNAINNMNSKSHLAGNKGGAGGITVPKDIKEMYRQFMPGITDEEISKDYEKSLKRDGKEE